MNWTLVRHTMHRLLTRTVAIGVIIAYSLYTLTVVVMQAVSNQVQAAGAMNNPQGGHWVDSAKSAWFLVWAIGTGVLGQERSDGYLPLLLSRPISRAQYVFSRWAGLVLSVLAIDVTLIVLALVWMAGKGQAPGLDFILLRWAWFAFFTVLAASWLTLLSACFAGHGDLVFFFTGSLAAYFVGMRALGTDGLQQAHDVLTWFWEPGDASFSLVQAGNLSGAAYGGVAFLVGAGTCLALAAYIMQRRDISYVNR